MTGPDRPSGPQVPRIWPFRRVYYGWAIVTAAFLAAFGQVPMLGTVLAIFVRPIADDLGWSRAEIALAFTVGSLAGSVFIFIIGSMLDRYGARIVVVITGLVVTLACLGVSVMTQPWHYWALIGVGRGSSLAGVQNGTAVAIANWFIRKRGRAIALKGLGIRVGQSVYPPIAFAIMAASSWRVAFAALGGLSFLFMVIPAALLLRRKPEDHGLLPDGVTQEDLEREDAEAASGRRRSARDVSYTLAEARRTRALWLITLYIAAGQFALGSVNLLMADNFESKGLSAGIAVAVVTVFSVTSAVTVMFWGMMMERVHVRYVAIVLSVIQMVAMAISLIADTVPLAIVFGILFGLGQGAWTVVQPTILADYFGRAHFGAIRGFTAPFRMVGPSGPVAAGFIFDVTGSYAIPFGAFAAIFALITLAIYLARPPALPQRVAATPNA